MRKDQKFYQTRKDMAGLVCSLVVECVPSIHEATGSITSTRKRQYTKTESRLLVLLK
jgi:hypothetical protein